MDSSSMLVQSLWRCYSLRASPSDRTLWPFQAEYLTAPCTRRAAALKWTCWCKPFWQCHVWRPTSFWISQLDSTRCAALKLRRLCWWCCCLQTLQPAQASHETSRQSLIIFKILFVKITSQLSLERRETCGNLFRTCPWTSTCWSAFENSARWVENRAMNESANHSEFQNGWKKKKITVKVLVSVRCAIFHRRD